MPLTITKPRVIVVIPARMGSGRLPRKLLLPLGKKSVLQHTYEAASKAGVDEVIVASSDSEIIDHCHENFISSVQTVGKKHPSGTHRVAEAVDILREKEIVDESLKLVVNLQGDEPFIRSKDITDLIEHALHSSWFSIWTIAALYGSTATDENVTKVVVSESNRAHWFSRAPMQGSLFHCGIYTYTPKTLAQLGRSDPTPLSKIESLEQLMFLENNHGMGAWTIDTLPQSINTEEDYKRACELYA